jgi:SAM-dependent methyltransferase
LDFGNQPIVNNLQVEPGNLPKFSIKVGGCIYCGLVQILNPIDPSEFYTNYANASSLKREPHLEKLIGSLESKLPRDAKIIDVGCNDGKFLSRLKESGFEDLYGLEPTKNMSTLAVSAGFRVYNSYLNMKKSDEIIASTGKFDCVVLRQVLEHIENLSDFGSALRNLLKPNGLLVIEVPDSEAWFNGRDYSLWEEHISYFDPRSLQFFLRLHEFKIIDKYQSIFAGVTLTVFARKTENIDFTIEKADKTIESFRNWANEFDEFKSNVQNEVKSYIDSNVDVAIYGIGARSSCFLNFTDIVKVVSFAIDDDPAKQGKYLPGTSILIRSREEGFKLLKENSLVLLGVNGENENKLLNEIAPPRNNWAFKSILPPSEHLLSAFNP